MERLSLRLQPYDVVIRYKCGTENPADDLSRHPLIGVKPNSRQEKVPEEFVNYLGKTSTPKTIDLSEVELATKDESTLQAVKEAIRTGRWHERSENDDVNISEFHSYEKIKDELCSLSNLILRGNRIIIPEALPEKVVDIAHKGHRGMVKIKALIREKVWFPKINRMIEEKIKSCLPCQATTPKNEIEPLHMPELPKASWS